ncbi:MAG: hypothetical protein DME46_05930 [Verrucomicrobia bacterium]|nr:MAG: hypothetical protein DME46_05930 [Verrucomicrobiota bacterium]
MARDYDFRIYIVTNEHDNVLYVGVTNVLGRRITIASCRRDSRFRGRLSL